MALIEWKAHYSVGVEAVDHEHREMIDLINDVHDNLLVRPGVENLYQGPMSAYYGWEDVTVEPRR